MPKKIRFFAFWAINGPLAPAQLEQQLSEFRQAGLDGVVWHPRRYPGKPGYLSDAYLAILSQVILRAKELGMAFWIYDEDGWPSGTVGGRLLREHPEFESSFLHRGSGTPVSAGSPWVQSRGSMLDTFDPAATACFIAMVHERYRRGLAPQAWEWVETFFSDEVHAGCLDASIPTLPWSPTLAPLWRARHGTDLLAALPALDSGNDADDAVRAQFWELTADALAEGFYQPLAAWGRRHGKRMAAHLKGEESPAFHVQFNGSAFRQLQAMDLPGVDILERLPGTSYVARMLGSVARQRGEGRPWVEFGAGAGWSVTPETLTACLRPLLRQGVCDVVMHLSSLRLDSEAVCDWPPSFPLHLSWREAVPELLRQLRNETTWSAPATLLVVPQRTVMAQWLPADLTRINIHDGAWLQDSRAIATSNRCMRLHDELEARNIAFDICDERTLEQQAVAEGEGARVGGQHYTTVIAADDCRWISAPPCRVSSSAALFTGAALSRLPTTPQTLRAVDLRRPHGITTGPWTVSQVNNALPLRWQGSGSQWTATVQVSAAMPCILQVHELVTGLVLNGQPVAIAPAVSDVVPTKHGCELSAGLNIIALTVAANLSAPPVGYLRGTFLVSAAAVTAGPNGAICVMPPFCLERVSTLDPTAASSAGLPFACDALTAQMIVRIEHDLPGQLQVRLAGCHGAAAQVQWNEHDLGWCWGPDWSIRLPANLRAGEHTLRVSLLPTVAGIYGPHQHYHGDPLVVSPLTFKYQRHFADQPDAPLDTSVAAWHAPRWGLGVGPVFACE